MAHSDEPEAEKVQYLDPRQVMRYMRNRIVPGLAELSEDGARDALIKAEDLLGNGLSVVRLCLGTIKVDADGA